MLHREEVEAALTRMAIASTRRLASDQMERLVSLWMEELGDVAGVGLRRAAHQFVQEGKWPTVGEFRTRARAMTPGMAPPAPEDGPRAPTCPVGHRLVWRKWTGPSGRVRGDRPWCLCMDRAADVYGETWGDDVPDTPVAPSAWRTLAGRIGGTV